MLKSVRAKIIFTVISLLVFSNVVLSYVSYDSSKDELTMQVKQNMENTVRVAAERIHNINSVELKMLDSLSKLPEVYGIDFDDQDSMRKTWESITSISKGNPYYLGMAIYNMSGIGWTTTGKWQDLHTREYLAQALKGNIHITDPEWSKVNGHLSTFYSYPIKDPSGKQQGVIVAVVDSLALCKTVADITIGKDSHPFIYNRNNGLYMASEDSQVIMDNKNIKDDCDPLFLPVIEVMNKKGDGSTEYKGSDGVKYSVAYTTVPEHENWIVVCKTPSSDFYSGLLIVLNKLIAVSVFASLLAIALCSALIRRIIRPLKKVNKNINAIATGNADLTQRIDIITNDEIGSVVKGFNMFTEKLMHIVSDIKESKENLSSAGDILTKTIDGTKLAITLINENIKNVENQLLKQNEDVDGTVSSVNDISVGIDSLESLIGVQTSAITEASAAVEQMLGNVSSVTLSIEKMADSFTVLLRDLHNGADRQHNVTEKINQIVEQSQMLEDANSVIASIAEQTNLLAMNAAIESAHAGEAGKGFSVVADEIRKLSETSTAQSHNIGEQLKKIKESIEDVMSDSKESDVAFQAVSVKIDDTNNLVQEIKNAMHEQAEGSRQISSTLGSMNDSTGKVKTASSQMNTINEKIMKQAQNLQEAASVMSQAVKQMSEKAESINSTSVNLSDISSQISSAIVQIGNEIDLFKV